MHSRTVFQCWFFILCFLFIALMVDFTLFTFNNQKDLSLHRLAPITSLPLLMYPALRDPHHEKNEDLTHVNYIEVVLKGGKQLKGKLISQEDDWLIMDFEGSQIGLKKTEVIKVTPLPSKK